MSYNERSGYGANFWNYIKGKPEANKKLYDNSEPDPGFYPLPVSSENEYDKAINERSIFRRLATVMKVYKGGSTIYAVDSDDTVQIVPEGHSIDVKDITSDFTNIPIESIKLAVILKLPHELVNDAAFDLNGYMVKRLARSYANAEDQYFINGSGDGEPEGVLTKADIGVTTSEISYDDVIKLFFSVKPEYREKGVWLMNDETAQALRTMKDDAGNYLWNQTNDTILGSPVCFSRFMPTDGKPIAFGDFSYYWVVRRSPMTVRLLRELFALHGQNGYLTFEFIDGKLIRPEAVKTLSIGA